MKTNELTIIAAGNALVNEFHEASWRAGWWHSKNFGDMRSIMRTPTNDLERAMAGLLFSNKLCLIHSEVSESMEGDRKGLADDKLPQYPMRVVELADAFIRICDLAGAIIPDGSQFTFGDVLYDKLMFNAHREDHRPEVRAAVGGKAY